MVWCFHTSMGRRDIRSNNSLMLRRVADPAGRESRTEVGADRAAGGIEEEHVGGRPGPIQR